MTRHLQVFAFATALPSSSDWSSTASLRRGATRCEAEADSRCEAEADSRCVLVSAAGTPTRHLQCALSRHLDRVAAKGCHRLPLRVAQRSRCQGTSTTIEQEACSCSSVRGGCTLCVPVWPPAFASAACRQRLPPPSSLRCTEEPMSGISTTNRATSLQLLFGARRMQTVRACLAAGIRKR